MILADPELPHQIQIRQLGNSGVYVSCNCLERAVRETTAARSTRRTSQRKATRGEYSSYRSLGDFQVGTPVEQLLAAYNKHLEEMTSCA